MSQDKQADVKHFHSRLGFGCSPRKIIKDSNKPIIKIINDHLALFSTSKQSYLTSLPEITRPVALPKEKRKEFLQRLMRENNNLTIWWLKQLHHTPAPLQERMTLFWHSHFTSSAQNVQWPLLMYRQNMLFRKYALDSFSNLLRKIYKDPAMLIYLNGNKSIVTKPNENFARELLELFTLGEGHYSEQDIIEAARAFTGWRYQLKQDKVVFSKKLHDNGVKHFMGYSGRFTANDIIDILLETPRTAEFIAEKFWKHFVNAGQPDKDYIQQWAILFRESGYQIRVLLSNIIKSDPFWASENRGAFIKSPVELTIGLLRELELDKFTDYRRLAKINTRLGQRLFFPPDVKGWRGGNEWIDNTTFILRSNFISNVTREHIGEMIQAKHPMCTLNIETLTECLLAVPPVNLIDKTQNKEKQLITLLTDPTYQLR